MTKHKSTFTRPAFYVFLITVVVSIAVLGIIWFGPSSKESKVASCSVVGATHTITLTPNGFDPEELTVPVCSRVEFVNEDDVSHLPAFGEHDSHEDVPGFNEKVLPSKGATNSFIPVRTEVLQFHDHEDDNFKGTLTITP